MRYLTPILVLLIFALNASPGFGQSAKEIFLEAKEQYESGKYESSLRSLAQVESMLGGTNAKILSLKTFVLYEKGENLKAKVSLERFKKLCSGECRNSDGFKDLISIEGSINERISAMQQDFEKDQREARKKLVERSEKESEELEKTYEKERLSSYRNNRKSLISFAEDYGTPEALQWVEEVIRYHPDDASKGESTLSKMKVDLSNPTSKLINALLDDNLEETLKQIDLGADVNTKRNGNPAIFVALDHSSLEAFKVLISEGAALDVKNNAGDDLLLHAILNRKENHVEYLLTNWEGSPYTVNSSGVNCFEACISTGNLETFTRLANKYKLGSEVEKPHTEIRVILSRDISQVKKLEFLKVMNATGMNWERRSGNQYSMPPLHHAVRTSQLMIAALILDYGVDINSSSNPYDMSPLAIACFNGDIEAVEFLLDQNSIKVNQQGPYGWTALHFASKEGNSNIVKELLDHGADIKIKDSFGVTAKNIARNSERKEILKLM